MSWRSVSFLLYAAEELIEPAVSQLIFLWSEFKITSDYMSWCVCWSVMEQTRIVAWLSGQLPVVKFEVLAISQALFTQLVLNLCSNFKLLILFLLFLLKLIHVCSIYSSTFWFVVFVCLLQFLHFLTSQVISDPFIAYLWLRKNLKSCYLRTGQNQMKLSCKSGDKSFIYFLPEIIV